MMPVAAVLPFRKPEMPPESGSRAPSYRVFSAWSGVQDIKNCSIAGNYYKLLFIIQSFRSGNGGDFYN